MAKKLGSFLIELSILILLNQLYQTNSIKRELINFQVYEENDVLKSKLNVNTFIDIDSELKLINKTKEEEVYNGSIHMKLPFPLNLNGKLRKVQDLFDESDHKSRVNQSTDKRNSSINDSKTIYKLNLNLEKLFEIDLNINHTIKDKNHQFVSELDFSSMQSKTTGQYLGTLRYNENECPRLTLYHNFSTNIKNLIFFSSNLTENCNELNKKNEMKITINFNNLINDLFDFKLDQVFLKQTKQGSELMTFINKIYQIKINGDYRYLDEKFDENQTNDELSNLKYQFFKEAIFESNLPKEYPTFKVKYVHDDKSKNKIKLSIEIKNSFFMEDNYKKEEL